MINTGLYIYKSAIILGDVLNLIYYQISVSRFKYIYNAKRFHYGISNFLVGIFVLFHT